MHTRMGRARPHTRLGGAAALCFFVLAAGTVDLGGAAKTVEESLLDREEAERQLEREMILAVVREYLRSTSSDRIETLADTIYDESVRAAIDPLLVASIVAKESSFRHTAVSPAGAIGLMQLRPFVAGELAGRIDLDWPGPQALSTPSVNLRLGILYYKELVDRFDGDPTKALTAYNYGPTRVSRQLKDGTYAGSAYAAGILSLYDRLGASRGGEV